MSSGRVTREASVAAARPEVPPVNRVRIGLGAASRVVLAGPCLGFAAIAVGSWLLVAVAHVRDAYGVDHVAGTWLALAQRRGEGTLYPPPLRR